MQEKPFVITIVGPESSGKTTLARQLAGYYTCPLVPEYAREYLERLDRPYSEEDLFLIAKGQLEGILEVLSRQTAESILRLRPAQVGHRAEGILRLRSAQVGHRAEGKGNRISRTEQSADFRFQLGSHQIIPPVFDLFSLNHLLRFNDEGMKIGSNDLVINSGQSTSEKKVGGGIQNSLLTFQREAFGAEPRSLVILDSGMLTLRMWARIKYGITIPLVEDAMREDVTSLYILCRPLIAWEADPLREAPALLDRAWIYNQYLSELSIIQETQSILKKRG